MGGSNRETLEKAFGAFARRDIDAIVELCDPDIVVRDPQRTGTTFNGAEGLRSFFEEWLENWEEYRSEPVEVLESGEEILVRTAQTGRGRISGIEVEQDVFQVFRMRDGKVTEYRIYTDREDALESMGAAN